ncbi:efflux RND transporter periplasmic adaptor subunit [bacterium]|nr:efflux RND transporter periplasmic adaptor subunit [bacterium]
MKYNRTALLCIGCFLLILSAGCQKNGEKKNDKKDEETLIPVEAAVVTEGSISAYYSSTATLETEAETDVVAKVGGVVQRIYVEEGDHVRAGQVLAKLDEEKLKFQVDQARASLDKLKNEYNRSQELFKKELISTETFQQAKYSYEVQKAAYKLAELDLDYTDIRAPIGGVVAERMIKVGNMVALHASVFRITGLDTLLAVLYVPERHLSKLHVKQKAVLEVDAVEGALFQGSVKRISPVVDPSSGTVKVTIEVTDKTRRLKPGMFTRVKVVYDVHEGVMLLPKDAVLAEDRASSVFVVNDSLVFKRDIETGYVNTTFIEITRGIMPGDTVVTVGKNSLKDSSRVEIVNMKKDTVTVKE